MNLEAVIQLHAAGHLDAAEHGYRSLIAQDPNCDVAYGNLAIICLMAGLTDDSIELLGSALRVNPKNPETHLNLGVALKNKGNYAGAISCWEKALEVNPLYPEAYLNWGVALAEQGDFGGAVARYQKALELRPNYPEAHYNLGNVFRALSRTDDAIYSYRRALELKANYPDAYLNLGSCLADKLEEAIACYQKALELRPDYPEAYLNLGNAFTVQGQLDNAITLLQKALELRPDYPEAYNNLGVALREKGKFDDAGSAFRQAIEFNPNYPEPHVNLGLTFKDQGRLEESITCYQKALELRPSYAEAYSNLGITLGALGRVDDAVSYYHKALEIKTANLESPSLAKKVGGLLNELERLPVVYKDVSEIKNCREHYASSLVEASSLVSNIENTFSSQETSILREVLFRITNFYLGYQQSNDKELQIAYSRLATNILMPEIKDYLRLDKITRSNGRIRLGIASEYLKHHNGSYWAYGWLSNLPKDDYEFFLYSLNGITDAVTQKFAALGTYRWLPFKDGNYQNSLRAIKGDNLDVLLLPDVGMTASSRIISLVRLAPIQCVAFAHPITTGSSNIDFYLSSELMETAESDSHYSEQLIRLPNIGFHFDSPPLPTGVVTYSDFGIPENRTVYGSVQSLFKYLPQFDSVYPAIAKQVPNAVFVFVGNESDSVTAVFRERLKNSFEQAGLDFEKYVRILPRMPLSRFLQLLSLLDLNIDSIGWNGGTTTLRSLAMDCPVVTLPGEFMRSRHSYAILKMLGAEELIAGSLNEYISLAVRIGLDDTLRSSIVDKIKAQKHRLFNDLECVEYLDRFFKSEVSKGKRAQAVNLEAVIELHAAGHLDAAEHGYRSLIAQNPNCDVAYANLAVICLMAGHTDEGIELLGSALRANPNNAETHLNLGVALKNKGNYAGAMSCLEKVLEVNPLYPEAYNNMGVALAEQGDFEGAVVRYQEALELRPNYPDVHYNLGNVFRALSRTDEAISSYQRALELRADYPDAYLNLGNCLADKLEESAYLNLGNCLTDKLEEAIACYQKAIELRPNYPEAYNNLGNAFMAQGDLENAVASLQKALELRPDYLEAYNNLGLGLQQQDKLDEAISSYNKALDIGTAHLESNTRVRELGELLTELLRLPVVYKDAAQIRKCREHYSSCLAEASYLVSNMENTFSCQETSILREVLFRITNFYLAYQQQNDKELQISYAKLATSILKPEINAYLELNKAPRPDFRIRVGIASENLKSHNGSYWAYGWLANLPREDYEFFLYSLNGKTDEVTQEFAALGTYRWLPFRCTNYQNSLRVIKGDNLDVLLLPDVGMTISSKIISLVRLAPIQCVAFAHPITTGSSNIDFYLSSELMETEESDNHYSEQLIRLPNIGFHFDIPPLPSEVLTCADFGIPENRTVYGSVQSLFKYLPQFDSVYPAIAKQVPNAIFIFVSNELDSVTSIFRERLRNNFEQRGLDFEKYVKIIPRMPLSRFLQLLDVLDVNIDSIGWNGGTTTLRSLAMDCPVVTLPGKFMRSRHSYAILKMLGAEELIAGSIDEYISLSSKIGLDKEFHLRIVDKIKAQKHRLFNDYECVEYLDRFLKSEVGKQRSNSSEVELA